MQEHENAGGGGAGREQAGRGQKSQMGMGRGRMRHGGMQRGMGCMRGETGPMGMMGPMHRMMGHMGGMGMMRGMGMCPMCGRPMGMAGEEEEGPYRGKGPAKRSDEQIRSEVEEALTEDSWLDASNVQVAVQNGVVTLSGAVDSRDSKRRAEDLTDEVPGVTDVQNNLRIVEA